MRLTLLLLACSEATTMSPDMAMPAADLAGADFSVVVTANVLTHHNNPTRDGVYVVPGLTRAAAMGAHSGITATTSGHTYAQALYFDGALFVATESNNVYRIDPGSGMVTAQRMLATPVPLGNLPCGNIDPLGITGTPVIDAASKTIYLDAMTTGPKHMVYGLSTDDLSVKSGWPVDVNTKVSGFDSSVQNERGALALMGGKLYVPYGGHYGDCGDYHGWLVGIDTANPASVTAWATPARGGGSWAPSGVASDGTRLYIATGNTFGAATWSGGEAILRFTAGPAFSGNAADYWSPTNWMALDSGDVDIGGTGPVLFSAAGRDLVLSLGKDGNAYLIDRANMGGVANAAATRAVSGGEIINAAVAYNTPSGTYVVFMGTGMGCPGGNSGALTALKIGAGPSIDAAWCAGDYGLGSPMVTTTDGTHESIVWWVASEGDDRMHAFDGESGAELFAGDTGTVRRYVTPIAAAGHIIVAGDDAVYTFAY